MRLTGASLMLFTEMGAPPEYAKMPPTGHTIAASVLRTERTGPILSGACELNIAAKRVMLPSTISS
jgi:hypothetical protein